MGYAEAFLAWASVAIGTYGYFGIAGVAAVGAATVFLPTFPLSLLVFLSAAKLNPIGLGIAAGIGSATGEMVGYLIGRGSERLLEKKYEKQIHTIREMFHKYRGTFVIFIFGAIPIVPFDLMGLFAGSIHFSAKKFYLAAVAGKTVRYTIVALAGYFGINGALNYFS